MFSLLEEEWAEMKVQQQRSRKKQRAASTKLSVKTGLPPEALQRKGAVLLMKQKLKRSKR